MKNKKKSTLRSNCCNAEVKYSDPAPDFLGDKHPKIGTCYCICSKCSEPCNVHSNQRKIWVRNPKTRIVPNKKKDQQRKIADEELGGA